MPIAAPVTAATTGLSQPASAFMKRNTGDSAPSPSPPAPGGRFMKSSRSLPEVKMPGWPVSSTARTAGSAPAATSASSIAWYMATVRAFFFSGRAISIVATPFSVAVLMAMGSVSEELRAGGRGRATRVARQTRSKMPAAPWPVPTHIVTMP